MVAFLTSHNLTTNLIGWILLAGQWVGRVSQSKDSLADERIAVNGRVFAVGLICRNIDRILSSIIGLLT